jgi:hypothetical protein
MNEYSKKEIITTPPTIPKRKRPRPSCDRPYTRRFNSRAMTFLQDKESGAADQFVLKIGK